MPLYHYELVAKDGSTTCVGSILLNDDYQGKTVAVALAHDLNEDKSSCFEGCYRIRVRNGDGDELCSIAVDDANPC
jgi:hypothetical protein